MGKAWEDQQKAVRKARTKIENERILARIKQELPKKVYESAKKASQKGPIALQVSKSSNGEQILGFVAVKAGETGGAAYKKVTKGDMRSDDGMYNFQHTTLDMARQGVTQKSMERKGKKVNVPTLDANMGLHKEGTIEEIKSYFAKNQNTYAIFWSAEKSKVPGFGAHSKAYSGQDEPDKDEYFPEFFEGQAVMEPGPVHIYVSGLALVGIDDKGYTSKGSWGDVITDVATNIIEFAGGAVAGAAPEPTTLAGQIGHSTLEGVGGIKDAKGLYDKYFKGKTTQEPFFSRDFVEDFLKFEVSWSQEPLDGKDDAIVHSKSLMSELLVFDDKWALGISMAEVGAKVDSMLESAMRRLERSGSGG